MASQEAQCAILESMGVPCRTQKELDDAVEQRLWDEWSTLVPETLVVTKGASVAVAIPDAQAHGDLTIQITQEDGTIEQHNVKAANLTATERAELRGHTFLRKRLPLPEGVPLGYHEMTVMMGKTTAKTHLIVCPERAYLPPALERGGKQAGIAVSLYSLRSARNWGCGDTTDLTHLVDWTMGELGGSFVALNPLHEIPNRQPYNTSPYLPNCSFYRNPIYLDVEQIEDFGQCPEAGELLASAEVQAELQAVRATRHVEYERVYRLKLRFLRLLFQTFLAEYRANTPRAQEFREFIQREGNLLRQYAVHAALDEVLHERDPNAWNYHSWPAEYQDPHSPQTQEFARANEERILFYQYLQWQLDRQFATVQKHAKERGMKIGLYHDLALATDRFGSDLWAHRDFYVAGCRVGAPPDDFSPSGQDWSFPPPNALAHRRDGYRLFRDSIRQNCKHGGALRIDHVMRFFRLYWIPDGRTPKDGVYVQDLFEDLLRVLALESVRQEVVVIGEDLGTVAPHVRETLARFGILSYRLLYFEKERDGSFKAPQEYPAQALVSASTHDLPTLSGFWTQADIEARRTCGFLPDQEAYQRMTADRLTEKQKLLDMLHRLHLLPQGYTHDAKSLPEFTGELHNAAIGFLASTPSTLLVLNQEDLFKDPEQQNLPGSTAEYPNWRHKMRFTVEQLGSDPEAAAYTRMYRSWIERSGR